MRGRKRDRRRTKERSDATATRLTTITTTGGATVSRKVRTTPVAAAMTTSTRTDTWTILGIVTAAMTGIRKRTGTATVNTGRLAETEIAGDTETGIARVAGIIEMVIGIEGMSDMETAAGTEGRVADRERTARVAVETGGGIMEAGRTALAVEIGIQDMRTVTCHQFAISWTS